MTRIVIAIASLALFFSGGASAKDVRLFSAPGVQAPNYDRLRESIQPGDTLIFGSGQRHTVTEFLGHGRTTAIYAISGEVAIRIPLASGLIANGVRYQDYVDFFLKGYEELRVGGVPVVEVYARASVPREYVLVHREPILFLYSDFLDDGFRASRELRARADADLIEFARSTWRFAIIGDQHPTQIAYTPRGWRLIDFTNEHIPARGYDDSTIFHWGPRHRVAVPDLEALDLRESPVPLPRRLHRRIIREIQNERQARGMPPAPSCAAFLRQELSGYFQWFRGLLSRRSPPR